MLPEVEKPCKNNYKPFILVVQRAQSSLENALDISSFDTNFDFTFFLALFPPILIEWSQVSTAMSSLFHELFQRIFKAVLSLTELQSLKLKQLP